MIPSRPILKKNTQGIEYVATHITEDNKVKFLCICPYCKKEFLMWPPSYYSGRVKSCGCNRRIIATECPRLYSIWINMKTRCYNRNSPSYLDYGAKGVNICSEWRTDFVVFRDWALSNGYSDELTIDRINVAGNYCPENCRWATIDVQSNNKRSTRYVPEEGMMYPVKKWCKLKGINYKSFMTHYYRCGSDLGVCVAYYRDMLKETL